MSQEPSDDARLSGLLGRIESAFAGVKFGAPVPPPQDGGAQAPAAQRRWQEVPEWELRQSADAQPLWGPAEFRFYLPALMAWVLRHLDDIDGGDDESRQTEDGRYSLLAALTPARAAPAWRRRQLAHCAALDHAQCRCVADFLIYLSEFGDEPTRADAGRALTSHWGRFGRRRD